MTQSPLPGIDNPEFFLPTEPLRQFVAGIREGEDNERRRDAANARVDFYRDFVAKEYREAQVENMETTLKQVRELLSTVPANSLQVCRTIGGHAPRSEEILDGRRYLDPLFCAEFGSFIEQDGELLRLSVAVAPLWYLNELSFSNHEAYDFSQYQGLFAQGERHLPPRREAHKDTKSRVGSVALPRTGMFSWQMHAVPLEDAMEGLYEWHLSHANTFYVQKSISMPDGKKRTLLGNALIGERDANDQYARPWGTVRLRALEFLSNEEWAAQESSGKLSENLLAFMQLGLPDRRDDYLFVNDTLRLLDTGHLALVTGEDGHSPINSWDLSKAIGRVKKTVSGVEAQGDWIKDGYSHTRDFALVSQLK